MQRSGKMTNEIALSTISHKSIAPLWYNSVRCIPTGSKVLILFQTF